MLCRPHPRTLSRGRTAVVASLLLVSLLLGVLGASGCTSMGRGDKANVGSGSFVLTKLELDASRVASASSVPVYREGDRGAFGQPPMARGTLQVTPTGVAIQVQFLDTVAGGDGHAATQAYDVLTLNGVRKGDSVTPRDGAPPGSFELQLERSGDHEWHVQPVRDGKLFPYKFTFSNLKQYPVPIPVPRMP